MGCCRTGTECAARSASAWKIENTLPAGRAIRRALRRGDVDGAALYKWMDAFCDRSMVRPADGRCAEAGGEGDD
jgi:hypothetical protein